MTTLRFAACTLLMVPLTYYYWEPLVESLDGSKPLAVLIVLLAWACGSIDLNEHMVGQPHTD
jgi:hypothetical protein